MASYMRWEMGVLDLMVHDVMQMFEDKIKRLDKAVFTSGDDRRVLRGKQKQHLELIDEIECMHDSLFPHFLVLKLQISGLI